MTENNAVSLQSVLQFATPIDSVLIEGSSDIQVNWCLTIRAQPPAFPDIYGGELALVSLDLLRNYDSRITLVEVIKSLAEAGISAIAVREEIPSAAIEAAHQHGIGLLRLPDSSHLPNVERAVNKLIANQEAQFTQRAIEIQRQLTRLAAENRDLTSLLQVIAGATAKPVVVHDDAGVLMAQVYPNALRRVVSNGRGGGGVTLPYSAFQNWLNREAPTTQGMIVPSPIGQTTLLKVEKRVAGYLTLVGSQPELSDFDRLVLTYGADVCAIELAKSRAIASAVEQARGDWIQMWLSGTPADDDLLMTRAQQSGFSSNTPYLVAVYRATTHAGSSLPLESLISFVRDDMVRRQIDGAIGQYVDVMVVLYPIENESRLDRLRDLIEDTRVQLSNRSPSGLVMAGVSRPVRELHSLREAYREAKDAMSIAQELGEQESTTFYSDLKLYQFLLALKDRSLDPLRRFYEEALFPLVEHDDRKQGELLRTLNGFFEANGNLAKAATDLAVHRNTLVYRLDQISKLTGMNLDDADNRLILHLALKVQRVLATIPS
jgi:PucR family transcriptional regulator, purine catabolism regulatory protein